MTKDSSKNFYPSNNGRIELDLREELQNTLHGASDEIAKGRNGFLRQVRRDSNGDPIRCPCRDIITDEPDKDYYFRYCQGVGFFLDEYEIVYYKNDDVFRPVGNKPRTIEPRNIDAAYFYVEYDENIYATDIIVEVEVDKSGNITYPIARKSFYEIWRAEEFKADTGRLEHWRVTGGLIRDWSTWYGVKHRQYG